MDGETGILQHRIKPLPLDRNGKYPLERVRRDNNKQDKRKRNRALNGQHARKQPLRHPAAAPRYQSREQNEDQHPEHHGALMIAPDA